MCSNRIVLCTLLLCTLFQSSVFELARLPYFGSLPVVPEDFIKEHSASYSCECLHDYLYHAKHLWSNML